MSDAGQVAMFLALGAAAMVAEVESRLDFAERLLARDQPGLPPVGVPDEESSQG